MASIAGAGTAAATAAKPRTCYTAPGVVFTSAEAIRAHYRTDWHRYNLKRKIAGLPPVTSAAFEKRKAAAMRLRQAQEAPEKGTDHLNKSKQRKQKKRADEAASSAAGRTTPAATPSGEQKGNPGPDASSTSHDSASEIAANLATLTVDQIDGAADPKYCIFDAHVCPTVEENVAYMQDKYNFSIPDAQYVSDLPGLLKYCVAKVRLGKICLYCNRAFGSAEGCRMHMRDMLHCRLPIGNEDDFFEEYGDYYDFSNALTEEEKKNVGTAELLETGEVLLRSADGKTGRILGSRHFKHIYRQNVKTEDERASVVAAKREAKERLLLMYERMGLSTRTSSNTTLSRFVQYQFHGKDLQLARKQSAMQQKKSLSMGMHNNLLMKHKVAGKIRGIGVGVHG